MKKIVKFISISIKPIIIKILELFSKLFSFLGKIFFPFRSFFSKFTKVFGGWEKIAILSFLIIIGICSVFLGYRKYYDQTKPVSAFGGKYVEGLVISNSSDLDQINQKLTKIGLTYFDNSGILQPALADKWEISDDGKIYTFTLKNGIDSNVLSATVKKVKTSWLDIGIETPDSKTLKFSLKEPYSPFLNNTSEPIFDLGPYKQTNQDRSSLQFTARDDFIFGKPYIQNIEIRIYPNEENLLKALHKKEIIGIAEVNEPVATINSYLMNLPRYQVAFFNLNKSQFQNKNVRQKIKNNQKLDKEITAVLVTNDQDTNLVKADELKSQWDKIGLKVEIRSFNSLDLQKTVILNRDYDILLYGIDYGYDPDPYPFWHTSQMSSTGLNLSNFSNQKADQLLEDARKTTDQTIRTQKYVDFQKILDDEVPAIYLNQITWKYGVSDQVKDAIQHNGFTPADRFNEIWKWYIETRRVFKS